MSNCKIHGDGRLGSWTAIIRHYKVRHYPNHITEMNWFREQASLHNAIAIAASSQDKNGKRYDHQRRIRRSALKTATPALIKAEHEIGKCKSFEDLILLIEKTCDMISGIGELYCYDAALRLGAYLKLEPDKVYLHRGTRQGAKRLGILLNRRFIDKSELPEPLRQLSAAEIEDILCIYADDFHLPKKTRCG